MGRRYVSLRCLGGHVEVLRWARENGCEWDAATQDRAGEELGYWDDLGNPEW